jgi:hypothetical protein
MGTRLEGQQALSQTGGRFVVSSIVVYGGVWSPCNDGSCAGLEAHVWFPGMVDVWWMLKCLLLLARILLLFDQHTPNLMICLSFC